MCADSFEYSSLAFDKVVGGLFSFAEQGEQVNVLAVFNT